MNDLANYGMIEQDFYTGIKPTLDGILMSKYYMNFETIKIFKEVIPQTKNCFSDFQTAFL